MQLTTPTSDLHTFPAPGPSRAPGEPIPPRVTTAPMVTLVDIHGDPVPDCERYTPTCPPDPEDPADWPESNEVDGWHWETGPDVADAAFELHPAVEPYHPTPEDEAAYVAMLAESEALSEAEDFYLRHPIAEFNSIRTD